MHATGYLDTRSRHPVALIAAISINLAVVGGMLAYTTDIIPRGPEGIPLIPLPKEPEIIKPVEHQKTPSTKPDEQQPKPVPTHVTTTTTTYPIDTPFSWPDDPPLPPTPTGEGETVKPAPTPVEVGAAVDPRYRDVLQPVYPPALERQEIEGKCTVRVQVGIDGRITAVELVKADNPAFFTATREQALRRWRFKPATRDGQPITSWVEKTIVFKMPGN